MKLDIRLVVYLDDDDVPSEFSDPQYFEEVIRENIEDVFIGLGMTRVDVERIIFDRKD